MRGYTLLALLSFGLAASCSGDDWAIAPGSVDDPRTRGPFSEKNSEEIVRT